MPSQKICRRSYSPSMGRIESHDMTQNIGKKNWTVKQVPGTLHQLSIKLKIIIGPDEN